jgi:hypothetical protein
MGILLPPYHNEECHDCNDDYNNERDPLQDMRFPRQSFVGGRQLRGHVDSWHMAARASDPFSHRDTFPRRHSTSALGAMCETTLAVARLVRRRACTQLDSLVQLPNTGI